MNRYVGGAYSEIPGIDRAWYGRQAPEGSPVADQLKYDFASRLQSIVGDLRLLYMPDGADGTTNTDLSRYAATLTYDATVAGNLTRLGSGLYWTLDGTADEADTPDAARYSFGDGTLDSPFSLIALVNVTATTGIKEVLTKYDITTGVTAREWRFYFDASEFPTFEVYDESAAANIGRQDATAAIGDQLFTCTYDGTRVAAGIDIYLNLTAVDDTASSAGTYVAMEDTASLVRLGMSKGASAQVNFFNGRIYMVALVGGKMSLDEIFAVRELCNSYFDMALGA